MSSHAFVDESKRHGLLIAAAVFQPRDLAPARTALRRLCLPGQSRLHFTKERDDRRRQILTAILDLGVVVDRYDATAIQDQRQARAACLRALVQDLADNDAQRLVLEQDDSLVRSDQAVLYAAVRDAAASDRLTYEHLPARTEPLLWVADAAALCDRQGSRTETARSPAHPPSGGLPGPLHGATAPCTASVRALAIARQAAAAGLTASLRGGASA